MNIISFDQAKREDLLEKADQAHKNRQFREAYGFLREALRFGENAAIFNRAATILNEMGEYTAALQVAQYALKHESNNPVARWELAVANERLWKLEAALGWLAELPAEIPPGLHSQKFANKSELEGMCHLKSLNEKEAHRALFRCTKTDQFPEPLSSRIDRLRDQLNRRAPTSGEIPVGLSLNEWMGVMYGHRLLYRNSLEQSFKLHVVPGRRSDTFTGDHFIMGHPSFDDCGRILAALHATVEEEGVGYDGVHACEQASQPVALAVSHALQLPIVDSASLLNGNRVLLCLGSNLDGAAMRNLRRFAPQHDLFILAKSFERDEFYNTVAPPQNKPLMSAWSEPIASPHRQIIGAVGEYITLPWEQTSIQAYEAAKTSRSIDSLKGPFVDSTSFGGRTPLEISELLTQAWERSPRR